MNRNLSDVIDQLLETSEDEMLSIELKDIKDSVRFTAPELMPMRWRQVQVALQNHISFVREGTWQESAFNIFTGRE